MTEALPRSGRDRHKLVGWWLASLAVVCIFAFLYIAIYFAISLAASSGKSSDNLSVDGNSIVAGSSHDIVRKRRDQPSDVKLDDVAVPDPIDQIVSSISETETTPEQFASADADWTDTDFSGSLLATEPGQTSDATTSGPNMLDAERATTTPNQADASESIEPVPVASMDGKQERRAKPSMTKSTEKPMVVASLPTSTSSYPAKVRAAIGRAKPKSLGASGVATVYFAIDGSGQLQELRVSRSSGSVVIDQAALATVRKAAPFPQPPVVLDAGQLSYMVDLHFR
jgi:TonB family protein